MGSLVPNPESTATVFVVITHTIRIVNKAFLNAPNAPL